MDTTPIYECAVSDCQKWPQWHGLCASHASMARRYDLHVDRLLELQSIGECEIPGCGRVAEHIDHNHTTGAVRGYLCPQCNSALGMVRDDPEVLRGMIAYLNDPPAPARLAHLPTGAPAKRQKPGYQTLLSKGAASSERPGVTPEEREERKHAFYADADHPKHGNYGWGYRYMGCRCEKCLESKVAFDVAEEPRREARRQARERAKEEWRKKLMEHVNGKTIEELFPDVIIHAA